MPRVGQPGVCPRDLKIEEQFFLNVSMSLCYFRLCSNSHIDSTCFPSNGEKQTVSWITKSVQGPISCCWHWSPKLLVPSLLNLFWETLVLAFNTYNLLSVAQPTSVPNNLLVCDSSLHLPSWVQSRALNHPDSFHLNLCVSLLTAYFSFKAY